jgi:hypothetical protein
MLAKGLGVSHTYGGAAQVHGLFCGEESGPILEEGEGTNVFVSGGVEEETLAVGGDVEFDHALAIGARGRPESEERDRTAHFKASWFFGDRDGDDLVAETDEIEFLAIAAPARPPAALGGDLPHTVAGGKRNDKDLWAIRGGQGKRYKFAIGGKLSAGLQAGDGRRRQERPGGFAGSKQVQPDFAAAVDEALGEDVAAVGGPVGRRIVVG